VFPHPLVAAHLMPAEVANILRRGALEGTITEHAASLAHQDLLDAPIELLPYEPFASRVGELLANLNAYDAWYVAIAEHLGAKLATLDERLRRGPGVRCAFEALPGP
jgi:predicted nucleic acid-binding protein